MYINTYNQLNNYLKYKEKFTSLINKKIFTLRLQLITFALKNKKRGGMCADRKDRACNPSSKDVKYR